MKQTKDYEAFLAEKLRSSPSTGFRFAASDVNPMLYGFQRDVVAWGLMRGRCAFFQGTGLGKTCQQSEWANRVQIHTGGRVLMFAPLAVAAQTIGEAAKFGITIRAAATQADCEAPGIYITNYQKLHHFDMTQFQGVVLDESSILKSLDGATCKALIESCQSIPFRLACTATPAPNDYMELGSHAEFLGVMTTAEMLAMYFTHDGGETQKWRLKRHAEDVFWRWVASWAVCITHPRDLGYDEKGFDLPPLRYHEHQVESQLATPEGMLFAMPSNSLEESRAARRGSIEERCYKAAEIANATEGPVLIWTDLNTESELITALVKDCVQVTGSDSDDHKEKSMLAFADGALKAICSKPALCGFGMNWQVCNTIIFVGVSHSFERFYQAVRRCWRFGQKNPVDVHIVISKHETRVLETVRRKEKEAQKMSKQMAAHMADITKTELHKESTRETSEYVRDVARGDDWTLHLGDCVEVVSELESDSIHYSIFSPPFDSLYTYSNSDRDMGNTRNKDDFARHFGFLIPQLYRVLMPGRLVSFHCMNMPTSKERDGYIGIRDFRGELIKAFQDAGFIYHSEVCIWKDPVTAMQRTKALGLLHKTIRKDSSMSRQGIADYLVTMRKPGENPERVNHYRDEKERAEHDGDDRKIFPVQMWQNYASPVWMDIDAGNTLQREAARDEKDERHICPLQLDVIRRGIKLWTNPRDIVLSPFAGIGSEGYVAVDEDRRFIGAELKRSYWKVATQNLEAAEASKLSLFKNENAA